MPTRLTAQWVLAHEAGGHRLLCDADATVVVGGGRVLHVGAGFDGPVDALHDYPGCLIAPGFVDLNALGDIDTTILSFSIPPETRPGLTWSRAYAERAREVLDRDDRVFGATFALAQCLRNGITTALPVTSLLARAWAEDAEEFAAIAEAGLALGIRLYLGPSFRSAVNVIEPDGSFGQLEDAARGEAGLDGALGFARAWDGRGGDLIRALIVPSTIETCAPALIARAAAAARDLGRPFRLHSCQSKREAEVVWRTTGRTSIGHLDALGVLGPAALLPHAVVLGGPDEDPALADEDRARLADSGAVVVHCPLVIGRSGRALHTFRDFRARGARIGMGTDTAPPDMLMNLQAGLITGRMLDPATSPADYLNAATLGGADALGRPDLGRLSPGAQADIAVFDLADPAVLPLHDPIQALFLAPTGRRVRDVFVAGRRVVADGRVLGFDEAAAAPRVAALFERLTAAYRERDSLARDPAQLFPPTYPLRAEGAEVRAIRR
jgi:cytosine/adenosine deaminase-related metal-dependent hydrolase